MDDKTLEADGSVTIYEIGSSEIVAQYEGLEVHEAMQENARLRAERDALREYAIAAFEMQDLLGDDNSGIRINGATSSEASMRKAIGISQRMWTARKKIESAAQPEASA